MSSPHAFYAIAPTDVSVRDAPREPLDGVTRQGHQRDRVRGIGLRTQRGGEQPAPGRGQRTKDILLELGYDWEAIGGLKERGGVP